MSECVQALKSRLGVASGITNENIAHYLPYIDLYLVATGISINYHELDEVKVRSLTAKMAEYVANKSTNNGK
jgi:predicted TIM-barrel enzyme